jgi:hypothetical protein
LTGGIAEPIIQGVCKVVEVEAGATAAYHCRVMQEATATPGRLRGSSRITSSHHHRHTEEIDAGNQEEVIGIGVVELGLEASDGEVARRRWGWGSRTTRWR